jgi:hypothetical protein
VSRLWPDAIRAGLFPEAGWIQRNRQPEMPFPGFPSTGDACQGLDALEAALDAQTKRLRKGDSLGVTVSDSIAAVTALPWQPQLHRQSELHAYAQACFAKHGVTIDDDWVMQIAFRQYGAMGLAYALPRPWLEQLLTRVGARGLRLKSAVPIAAVSYSLHPAVRKDEHALVLLCESSRISAMLISQYGLQGYDIEPVIGSTHASITRLLTRAGSWAERVTDVYVWSALPSAPTEATECVAHCMPAARLHRLVQNQWSG